MQNHFLYVLRNIYYDYVAGLVNILSYFKFIISLQLWVNDKEVWGNIKENLLKNIVPSMAMGISENVKVFMSVSNI